MAEETLIKEILSKEMVESGRYVIKNLADIGIFLKAAFWLYTVDMGAWRLFLASSYVKDYGPKKIYKKIQSILSERQTNSYHLDLQDITVIEDDNPLVAIVLSAIKDDEVNKHEARFSKTVLNGHFIEDIYVYLIIKER